ncbi:unnamed protein product [Parajaminaea phylloscopi]
MASIPQDLLDRVAASLSRLVEGATGRNTDAASSLGLAGALAVALATTYWTLPSFDRKTLPDVKRAPKLIKGEAGEPYPEDILPNGRYLETPIGRIRYYEFGPEKPSAGHIILVHGITTPQPWSGLAPALTEAGYRVLTFDLPGRGASDSPQIAHDTHLYMSTLTYLLTALPHWPVKFHLLGMSLGGGIVANFAHYFPERVDKLILMCPAGAAPKDQLRFGQRLFGSGYLGMSVMTAMAKTLPLGLPLSSANPLVSWQASNHPGFFFSFLSSYRSGPIFGQAEILKSVVRSFGSRVTAVWGDYDSVVPMSSIDYLGEEGKQLRERTIVIPGGEHFIVVSRPKETAAAVLKQLQS